MASVLQFLLAFGVVLFFLLVVYYLVQRKFGGVGGSSIAVIEKRYLDRKAFIAIVRIVDEYYAILVTDGGGQVIRKLEDFKERESFSAMLFKRLGRREK